MPAASISWPGSRLKSPWDIMGIERPKRDRSMLPMPIGIPPFVGPIPPMIAPHPFLLRRRSRLSKPKLVSMWTPNGPVMTLAHRRNPIITERLLDGLSTSRLKDRAEDMKKNLVDEIKEDRGIDLPASFREGLDEAVKDAVRSDDYNQLLKILKGMAAIAEIASILGRNNVKNLDESRIYPVGNSPDKSDIVKQILDRLSKNYEDIIKNIKKYDDDTKREKALSGQKIN